MLIKQTRKVARVNYVQRHKQVNAVNQFALFIITILSLGNLVSLPLLFSNLLIRSYYSWL